MFLNLFFRDTFELRGPDFNELISYPNLGTDSINRQSYAFGLIINIDGGGTPGALVPMYDVFAEVDITLMQLTQTQTLDMQNQTSLSQKRNYRSGSIYSKESDTKSLSARLDRLELQVGNEVDIEDIVPNMDRKNLEKKLEDTIRKVPHVEIAYADEIDDLPSAKKSSSIKSNTSVRSRN